MIATPHANGGELLQPLRLPDVRVQMVDVPDPGGVTAEATRALGAWIREVVRANPANFRLVVAPNRLQAV